MTVTTRYGSEEDDSLSANAGKKQQRNAFVSELVWIPTGQTAASRLRAFPLKKNSLSTP